MFLSAASLICLIPGLVSASPIQKRLIGQVIKAPNGKCLSLPPNTAPANNVQLITVDCSQASKWDVNLNTPTSVILSGTGFALDAGVPQQNFNPGKIYQTYPGSPQQTWYVTPDNRIAVYQGNQCLDLDVTRGPQTYQCTTGNTNQVWLVQSPVGPVSSSSSSASSSSASHSISSVSSSSSASSSGPAPSGTSTVQIKWKQNPSLCATLQGTPGNGVLVNMANCNNPTSPAAVTQNWIANNGGVIQIADTRFGSFCLDLGLSPANGVQMKVWQCYPGAPQQTWDYPATKQGLIKNSPSTQCLDINNNGNTQLQTWACSTPDPQQQFILA